ncbi:MAG: Ycf48-like protein [Ignavibacteria bacterium]|nr:Ycf48-like protein [Ignavibacteria bacterium]
MKSRINIILVLYFILLFVQTSKAQWFTQQSGTTAALYDIEFINDKTGWCSGSGGYIIKTTNGGLNWIRQGEGVTFEPLFGIHPVDSNTVYAVGFFRTVVKTTNGGGLWIKIESGTQGDGRYTCVYFVNQNTGYIGNFGPGYGVRKTTDGGKTIFPLSFSGIPQDLYFKDSLNGIGVGWSSYIYRTTNGGLNWSSNAINVTGDFYRVSFINENTGYTANRRAVYKTTNFGVDWDSVGFLPIQLGSVYSVEFSNDSIGWAATQYQVFKTLNGGNKWRIQNSIKPGVIYSLWSYNDSLVWGCGNGGKIWHTITGGDTTTASLNIIFSNILYDFELMQNYPNPFNNQTRIKFRIKEKSQYKFEVHDILGKRIDEVFNEYLYPGIYEITYNSEYLSSGIYIYTLSGDGNNSSKKFLLIK